MGASREKKSETVRGAGFLAAFWISFEAAVREAGGSNDEIHRLGTEEGADTLRKMARVAVLRGECEIVVPEEQPVETTYPVTVDHGQSLEEMIATGRYGTSNSDITAKHFPITGAGQVEVQLHLVHLNRVATTDEVLAELDRRGLRPATLPELLAFGAKYPDLQREFPIAALGSVWRFPDGRRLVAALDNWSGGRGLDLHWLEGGWGEYCRFAAVSK